MEQETTLPEGKRAQIIDAAVAEFRERGFHRASMDRVSARANVSKRTVYNHFASKEALFRAILDTMAQQVNQAVSVVYVSGVPVDEQLTGLGWTEGKLLTDPDFMKLARMVVGETMRDPALAAEMNARMDHMIVFEAFMADAAGDGALVLNDPARAATQFIGLLKAEAFWPMIFSGEVVSSVAMAEVIAKTVELFLAHYGPKH